jgi:hypothetical protein
VPLVSEEVLLARIKRAETNAQSLVEALRTQVVASDRRIQSQITGISSKTENPNGQIQTSALVGSISRIQLEDDYALAEELSVVEATLSDLQTTSNARIRTIETSYASKIYTEARKVETLEASNASATALVVTETSARVEGDAAIAGVVRTITATAPAQWSNFILQSSDLTIAPWVRTSFGAGSGSAGSDYPLPTPGFEGPAGDLAWRLEAVSGGLTVAFFSFLSQVVSGMADPRTQTTSLWLKSNTGVNQQVYIQRAATFRGAVTVTPEWQRFEFSDSVATPTSEFHFGSYPFHGSDQQIDILVAGIQMSDTGEQGPFVPTGATAVTSITASITEEATVRADAVTGIHARWGVQIDGNGRVVGRVRLDGTGDTSEFSVLADTFQVSDAATSVPVFVISGAKARFTSDVEIDGSLLIGGTLSLGQVSGAGDLAALDDADWGTQVTGAGKPANDADVTLAALNGGLTITSGTGVTLSGTPSINSSGFTTGTTGWSIDADGSAEFNDVVVRGSIGSGGLVVASSMGLRMGDDSSIFTITGGSDNGVDNGAQIDLTGATFPTEGGVMVLSAGDGSNGKIILRTGNAGTIGGNDYGYDRLEILKTGETRILGGLEFGTHSALGAETLSGFVEIKDLAGNTRKIAVIS